MSKFIRYCVISLTLLVLFLVFTTPALAETPSYIPLVSDPENAPKTVYYCEGKDAVKRDPEDFLWETGRNNGQSLVLNGKDQYLRLATAQVKQLSAFTFSSWVKWNGTGGSTLLTVYRNENYCISVSMKGESNTDGLTMKWVSPNRDPIILTKTASDGSSFAFPANEWHHLAVTVSSTEFSLYVDSALYLTQTVTENIEDMRLDKFRVGAGLTPKPAMAASLQDARLYTDALTAQQIALLAKDKEPDFEGTLPTETLATRPSSQTTITIPGSISQQNGNDVSSLLGLPTGMWILLGGIVVFVVVLSVIFSKQSEQKEETL